MPPSLVIDRRYTGVGRLKKATTPDPKMHALYVAMCDHFDAAGAVEWLLALKRGPVKGGIAFAEAYRHFKPTAGRVLDITRLPSPETVQRLWQVDDAGVEVGAARRWLDALPCSDAHRANIARDLRWLRTLAGGAVGDAPPTAAVAALPELVRKARLQAVKQHRRRSFNMLRDTCRALLRDTVGVRHALYFAVVDLKPLDEQRKPTTGLPLDGVARVAAALTAGAARKGAEVARAWRALCYTGMRPAELWQEGGARWTLATDHVAIYASKTATWRTVPLVDAAVLAQPMGAARKHLEWLFFHLHHGSGPYAGQAPWPIPVSLYTGRRTFRHACEMAGVPDSRASAYRSASPRTVDARYTQHDVTPYLAQDAARLRAWFGLDDAPPTLQVARGGAA